MAKGGSLTPSKDSPFDRLLALGVKVDDDGGLKVPAEAMQRLREERARRATMSRVPSTSRWMPREAGGIAVRKGHGDFGVFSMLGLREVRESSPIIQAIHRARLYQVRRMAQRWSGIKGDVGWRVVHRDFHDARKDVPASIKPYIATFERILASPAPSYSCTTAGAVLGPLWDDLATINRPTVEVLYSAMDRKRVVGFRPVDGAILWPTLVWLEKWVRENPRWAFNAGRPDGERLTAEEGIEVISQVVGHDLMGADYCLVREGTVEATYDDRQILCAPWFNRTDIRIAGYPPSHVEDAIEAILAFANTWEYNSSQFTRGLMAEFILGISGDIHDDDIDAFVDMLREAAQGVRRAHQPPVMPLPADGDIKKIDLKPNNKDMQFEVWMSLLIALACACYRMHTSTINAKPWEGGSGAALSDGSKDKEIALAKEEGLQGDLGHLCDALLTPLAKACHPDLEVVMEWGDFDPQKEGSIHEIQARVHRSRNEIRRERGDIPWGFCLSAEEYQEAGDEDKEKHDANPWNHPTDATFAQAIQTAAMAKQQQDQGQPGEPGPPEEPPPDDGYGEPADGSEDGFGGQPERFPYGRAPGQQAGPRPPQAQVAARPQPPPAQPMTKGRQGMTTIYVTEIP